MEAANKPHYACRFNRAIKIKSYCNQPAIHGDVSFAHVNDSNYFKIVLQTGRPNVAHLISYCLMGVNNSNFHLSVPRRFV